MKIIVEFAQIVKQLFFGTSNLGEQRMVRHLGIGDAKYFWTNQKTTTHFD